ncbi:MAG: DUF4290 domain-containing protein [Bacteroidetes bacterium]|nr:DUF4290 domain-containing protein [Rhodothermia bacterium]MCS7155298.1 DUF4290 domain-containing protein [Bacteroidota bacterium]MCX7907883.1 DUF4290 domain-containing protein [Bacteroidota bacterium]MDW8138702.1 DUF4290 domain-containing protein [Bacteroidota bacterium]MDW8284712.1 DUF4290 domain-containing protein [Bacteroidota bacterium]
MSVTSEVVRIRHLRRTVKIVDRQVGRNAQLYAQAIAQIPDKVRRYPHLRVLISIIEQAHPDWAQAPQKDRRIAELIRAMEPSLEVGELLEVVRAMEQERPDHRGGRPH